MDEDLREVRNHFRTQQEKYTYYIIALCVASIGFSVYKTTGVPLKLSQIPLGIAILLWSISIYCGLKFMAYVISTLYANSAYLNILKGRDPKIGTNPEHIEAAASGVKKAMELNSEAASRHAKCQNYGFYFGCFSFLVWHILEMFLLRAN